MNFIEYLKAKQIEYLEFRKRDFINLYRNVL